MDKSIGADKVTRAFGKLDLTCPLPLRSFEKYFGIKAREGPEAWKGDYTSVQNLLNHLSRYTKSESSREKYLGSLRRFCLWSRSNPDALVRRPQVNIEALVQNFVDELAKKDSSRTHVNSMIKRLKTFFRVNDYTGNRSLRIATYHVPTRYRKRPEYIPSKDEIHNMADAAGNPRNRALILILWSGGLRVSTLSALNYGDVAKELKKGQPCVMIPVYPEMKLRVSDACKERIPYYTFICTQAVETLKTYLRERQEKYGPVYQDDPLFNSEWSLWQRDVRSKKRLGRRAIGKIVKRAARLAGIPKWMHVTPHCLRKSFESVLRSPTLDGGRLDMATQQFLFGHILPGSQDVYYDKTKTEFHRVEYLKLNFSKSPFSGRWTNAVMAAVKIASTGFGENPEDIIDEYVRVRYGSKTAWKLWPETDQLALIKEALEWRRSRQPRSGSLPLDKIITTKNLERHLNKGWIFVAQLNNQKVVVRRIRQT